MVSAALSVSPEYMRHAMLPETSISPKASAKPPGRPWPPQCGIGGHGDPAVLAVAVVGFLEARAASSTSPFSKTQAVHVADAVGGRQHVLGETRALLEDALEQVAVEVVAAVGAVVFLEVEHVMDDEADVTKRSAVRVHDRVLL